MNIQHNLEKTAEKTKKTRQPPQVQDRQPGLESKMRPQPDFRPEYPGSGKLKGKVAIITGGDSGIGRAVAIAFAREGAADRDLYLDETRRRRRRPPAWSRRGADALQIAGDVGDEISAGRRSSSSIKELGRLDILVNNAAEQHEEDDLADISDRAARAHLPHQRLRLVPHDARAACTCRTAPRIINTTSITAYQGPRPCSTTPPPRAPSSPSRARSRRRSSTRASASTAWRPGRSGRR